MNQKVHLFNQIIKNILCNFIPYKTVTCDDREPPWINSKIKGLIQEKNIARSAISKITKIFSYFGDFNAYRIS